MGCGCGKDKPKGEGKSFTKAVIEINNREKITLLRKVVIPTSLGDETTIPPAVGEYRNVILVYEASKRVYIYSSDGIPTLVAIDPLFIESELEKLGIEIEEEKEAREEADAELSHEIEAVESDLEAETAARIQADNGLQGSINTHTTQITNLSTQINTETTNRQNADIDLQNQIDAISASSDVKDIVGTYQELQNYDTSGLGNNDIIKVLRDETQDGATTYYRWNAANQTFSLIGEEGPYYTKSETDSLLTGKQDVLEAGENISIIGDIISATDTTYTAGSGLDLTGTEFSVDTSTIQEKLAAGNNISINGNTISATDTTYTAGSGLDLTGTEFSIDSTVALKTDLPTVNNATLTVQKNGTDVATFTANSASDVTANITVPTDTAQLTNTAGYQTASDVQNLISGKQNTLTPGTNIQISNDVISATDTTYSAGNGLNLTGTTFSADTDILQTKLTPGSNIQISNGVISSDGPTYSAGTGLDLTGNVFSIDNTVALKSDIPTISTATLTIQRNGADVATFLTNDPNPVTANILVPTNNAQLTNGAGYQTASDVQSLITGKQDVLTPGNNIQINNNTISATDTTYTGGTGIYVTGTVISADTDVLQSKLTAGNNITISSGTISATDTTYSDFTGADASTAGTHGLVPAPIAGDQNKFLRGDGTWANDNTELVEMAYGESNAWAKFIAAYTDKKIVYCRASSNSNPGSGAKTRKAFMAYVNDETTPTSVEFQYVRSVNPKSNSQQCDQVFVYTLTSANGGTWSVATRNMATTVNVDSSLTKTYTGGANATMTLKANAMTGATSSVAGTAGYVPAPAAGDNTKYLSGDGTWKTVSQYALPIATANDLGGIKVGNNLSIDSTTGVLDAVVPTVNNATLTIQKNGTSVGTFTANASSNKSINITVPTSAADVSALPASTKYGASIAVSINTTDYKVTTTLKDQDGNTLGTAQVIDLPLESVVVNGSYDSTNKKIVLTLQSGSTIDIPVGDLVAGLQSEITSTNKLSSDLVDDTNHTHKFVTAAQITKLNGIAAGAEVNVQSDWDQTTTTADDYIKNKPTLATVATSGSYNDLSNKPTIPAAQVNSDWNATSGVARILNKPTIPTATSDLTNDSGFITNTVNNLVNYTPTTGLAEVATSGSYNDLEDKPTIPAAQVNSDWNSDSGVSQILNKPALATVATSGSYNDLSNKPIIPAAQVQSNWTQSDNTKVDYIKNKPSLATVATSGSYNDLSNKPTIPTVNNATLTIQKNGTTVKTFTANASSNVTANITVPTKTSDLTNNGADNTSTYVEADELATVATSGSYNDLSNKPTIPAAQIQSNWTQTNTTSKDYIKNKPNLATVATSGSYNDLSNKPTIPTVNNGTLTIQHNEETVQTFTANASSNKTANINATKRFKIADSTADFSRWVIALCRVSTTNNTALNSYSIGTLSFHRDNGLSGAGEIEIAIDNRYSTAYVTNVSYASNFPLLPQNADLDTAAGWRPCTFKYNDVWYGGIEVMIGTAVYGYMEFNGATNENVFGVKYYTTYKPNSSTPAVIENQEIYDSLMYDKWVHERGKFYFDSVDVQSGTISKGSGQYTATLPNKTGTIAMTSDAQKFAIGQGSTNPVFDDMTPIRTFEWDVSDANYRPIYTIANTGLTYINLDVTVAYRITITGTNINGVVDVVDRWHNPASYPITSMFCRTLSTAAATTGLRYLRAVYPTSSYINNASYPLGQEIAMYNTTARHVKVEVFKDNSQVTWNTTKPSGSIYVSSTYNNNSVMNAYDTRGWRFRQPVQMQASGASYASYISDYEPVTVGVNDLKSSGTALAAGHMAFLAEDGKVYDISNTTQSIAMGPSKIGYMNSNVNANTVISSTYWRAITRLGATQFGYFGHDTVALGDRLFLRCTMDSNGKIHSDNYLAKSMSAGYTWMPFGCARSATTAYVDTRHPIFYTINSNGKLTHINGIQVAGSSTIASYSSGTLYLTNPT